MAGRYHYMADSRKDLATSVTVCVPLTFGSYLG
jgi:hypothetical protein